MDFNEYLDIVQAPAQVPIISIVFMAISALVSIGLPVAIFVHLRKHFKAGFVPMLIGAAAFVLFALVLESIIHSYVFKNFELRNYPAIYVIYGIFMAGIFEETARFLSFKILKKKHDGLKTGLSYGIGHGGIEAILLAGFAMISSIILAIVFNTGNIDKFFGSSDSAMAEQITAGIKLLLETESPTFLLSGLERVFAISIQMSLTIMVFYAVYCKGKIWLYPCAILLHAIIDIPAAMFQVKVISNLMLVEGLAGIAAIVSIALAVNIHQKYKKELQESALKPEIAG